MLTRDRNVHKVCFSLGGEDANRELNWSRIRSQASWYIVAKYLPTCNALHYGLNHHHRRQRLRSRKIRVHYWHIFGICPIRASVYTLILERKPSWKAIRSSNAVQIPHVLWNLHFNYRAHKTHNLSLSRARSIQSTPIHLFFLRAHFSIIFPHNA